MHITPLLVDFSRLLHNGVQLLVCVMYFFLCTCYIILGREEERRGGGKRGERGERGEERRREEREGEEKLSLTPPHEILTIKETPVT